MTTSLYPLLLLLGALQIKHAIGDFFLQSKGSLAGKSRYLSRGGATHAFHHAWLCLPPLLWFTGDWTLSLALALLDGVVHFHIDWQKALWTKRFGWEASMPRFWHAFALDQTLHQMTYLMIAALAVRFSSGP